MNKKAMMRWALCGALGLCHSLSGGAEADRPDIPVQVWLAGMGVSLTEQSEDGNDHQSANETRELALSLNVAIPSSACFGNRPTHEEQELTLTDSSGHTLSPAQFHITWLLPREDREGMIDTYIRGVASELPPEGVSWVRLTGVLHLPIGYRMASPVYELPLQERAEVEVPLPMDDDELAVPDEDIAGVKDVLSGTLSITKLEFGERNGKKTLCVGLALKSTVPWALIRFELVDKEGNALKVNASVGASSSSSKSWEKEERYEVEPWEGMDPLRVKLIYKAGLKNVPVPVDMKIGLRGVLPNGK